MAGDKHSKSDHDHKKAKRKKLIKLIVIVAVIKAIIVAFVALAVIRTQSPKLKLRKIRLQALQFGTPASPSFDLSFTAEAKIKNPNFGKYEYEATTVSFVYEGIIVGQASIPAGKVAIKSTNEVPVFATASYRNLVGLAGNTVATELGAGVLSLRGKAVMRGKVVYLRIVEKRKNAEMDCFLVFNLATRMVQRLEC